MKNSIDDFLFVKQQFRRQIIKQFAWVRVIFAWLTINFYFLNQFYNITNPPPAYLWIIWQCYGVLSLTCLLLAYQEDIFGWFEDVFRIPQMPTPLVIVITLTIDAIWVVGLLLTNPPYSEWAKLFILIILLEGCTLFIKRSLSLGFAGFWFSLVLIHSNWEFWYLNTNKTLLEGTTFGVIYLVSGFLISGLAQYQLNEMIVNARQLRRIQTQDFMLSHVMSDSSRGILLIDESGCIQSANRAALNFLSLPDMTEDIPLQHNANLHELYQFWHDWQLGHSTQSIKFIKVPQNNIRVELTAMPMEYTQNSSRGAKSFEQFTLAYIEDWAQTYKMAQEEKLKGMGRLVAAIAHEIRNPLSSISYAGELLQEQLDKTPVENKIIAQRCTQTIMQQSQRINQIIEDILILGRNTPVTYADQQYKPVVENLKTFLEQWLPDWLSQSSENLSLVNLTASTQQDHLPLKIPPSVLEQILRNLLHNACRYANHEDGSVEIRLQLHDKYAEIWVVNNGHPVNEIMREHLFEPFMTSERSGSGLGLYISRELVQAYQGKIEYIDLEKESQKNQNNKSNWTTAFVITLTYSH